MVETWSRGPLKKILFNNRKAVELFAKGLLRGSTWWQRSLESFNQESQGSPAAGMED